MLSKNNSRSDSKREFIAHVKQNPEGIWIKQSLEDHLNSVAKLAGEFTAEFGNKDWGELLGYWHDLGKYLPAWQAYLMRNSGCDPNAHIEGNNNRPNHSTAGAVLAIDKLSKVLDKASKLLAYGIAGHHAGLPDWYAHLDTRLLDDTSNLNTKELDLIRNIPEAQKFIDLPTPKTIPSVFSNTSTNEKNANGLEQLHLWVRLLYSSLVDADFLDTEKFMNPERFTERGDYKSLNQLKEKFDVYMSEKSSNNPLNKKRDEILELCRDKAKLQHGFFSLNVPTGGGKTLSSMAFALEHAIKHNKKRIIVAIPYTSIIEQTAKVFKYGTDDDEEIERRKRSGKLLFGEDQVLEHHSNLDPESENYKNRLASENWDAPIIVTTNVQLFESLFAKKTSSCRKLHNIVNSVIILDEVQMLPPEFLKPILSVLKGLVNHFGVTVVLMTATQPTLIGKIGLDSNSFEGISNVTNIIDDPDFLSKEFKRVEINFPENLNETKTWKEIAGELKQYEQVLCVVNRRDDCRQLHSLMPAETIHLSGFMCGEERSEVISDIKQKLRNGEPIRVISTQLVEAGVDIDFPVVYRALAGLDSIAQAAGRCNRENKLAQQGKLGKVVVFNPPKPSPSGLLRKGEDACKSILRTNNIEELTPTHYSKYFEHFYSNVNEFDKPEFYNHLVKDAANSIFNFRTFAERFNLIDDVQKSIIVLYVSKRTGNSSEKFINELKFKGPSKQLSRKLQRFIVNVPVYIFDQILKSNYIEPIQGYYVQCDPNLYKPGIGLLYKEDDWIIGNCVV